MTQASAMPSDRPLRILLMTATVTPATGVFLLQHRDPVARLREYCDALSFYVDQLSAGLFDRIVIAENSGYDFNEFKDIVDRAGADNRVEFIAVAPSAEIEQSRFALELALLEAAFDRSRYLNADDGAQIWKVTGRYRITNIGKVIDRSPRRVDVVANFRDYPQRTVDFYLIAMTPPAIRSLLFQLRDRYQGTRNGEEILREVLDESPAAAQLNISKRFAIPPRIEAIRGFDGARYGGAVDTAKFIVRSVLQLVAPKLWV